MSSKIISGETAAVADRWTSPAVDDSPAAELKGAARGGAHLLSESQVDSLQSAVQSQAFERGYREGLERGADAVRERVRRFELLVGRLNQPFDELDASVEQELLELAKILARHLLRRELKSDPNQIIGAVRDCMEVLPTSARNVRLFLSPDDAQLMREYGQSDDARSYQILEDVSIGNGNLRVESDASFIDGRIGARLNEIVGAALATRRSADPEP